MKTEEFSLSGFTRVSAGAAFEIEIVRSDSYSVSITADDELFKNLKVSKEDETLKIGRSPRIGWRAGMTGPKAHITMPILNGLRLSGASKGKVSGFSSSEEFKLDLSGASRVSGDIVTGNAEFNLSGASRAELTGSANDAIIEGAGASRVELDSFSLHDAAVKLGGASRCTVKVEGTLNARLSGASRLSWIGNPVMGDIRTSGASKLSKKG